MSKSLEERLLAYLQENAADGRLLIKLDDLSNEIGETRTPVYSALTSLVKRRKIKRENRSKLGMEITLMSKPNAEIPLDEEIDQSQVIPIEELSSQIRLLNLNQLFLIKDTVDMTILKKKGEQKL